MSLRLGEDFLDDIQHAFIDHLGIDRKRLIAFPNSEKYAPISEIGDASATHIFQRLCEINLAGVTANDLCRGAGGQGYSFRESLAMIVTKLTERVGGRAITYIELGPEPTKTALILGELRKVSPGISYIGVDINAASRPIMEQRIGQIVGHDNFSYLIHDYHTLKLPDALEFADRDLGDSVVVLTSLGSQEGNEHPEAIHFIYKRFMRSGDQLVSELQLLPETNHHPIFEFSHHPLWRDVSKSFCKRVFGDVASEYGTVLIPVSIEGFGAVKCAVATEKILQPGAGRGDIMITNYCLKYSLQELLQVRRSFGFEIVASAVTGDGSVVFQLLTPAIE